MAVETKALAAAEACLPAYLATDSDASEDDEDFIFHHFHPASCS
jgi:hypothetical protein